VESESCAGRFSDKRAPAGIYPPSSHRTPSAAYGVR
jgi:hypothetical protein